MALEIEKLPAEERSRLIKVGRLYGSADTLAQANKTLAAFEKHKAEVEQDGFGQEDADDLKETRDLLLAAGGARVGTQTAKKTTRKEHNDAMRQGKTARTSARAILIKTRNKLAKVDDQDSVEAKRQVEAALEKTSAAGANAQTLSEQLSLLNTTLKLAPVAAIAKGRGGPLSQTATETTRAALQEAAKVGTLSGTPAETERLDLLDGIIVELARDARRAARAAATRTGGQAIAEEFALTHLESPPAAKPAKPADKPA